MRKKLIAMSVIAAAMTAAMSITAFAGWVQEREGWAYYRDDGSRVWMGWFTDPADGSIYYIDPDGYMMTETRMEGYWLGADGRRVDKTEAEIQREAERAEREASRPTPNKVVSDAKNAANVAKKGTSATSTIRRVYQAEIKVLMDKYYIATAEVLGARTEEETKANIRSNTTENNIQSTYSYLLDGQNIISTSLYTVTIKNSINYKPHATETSYNRAILTGANELPQFDILFKQMLIASLGDTTGEAVYNGIFEQLGNGVYTFESTGNTDAGNYYTLSCADGVVSFQVTCSEITESEGTADETAEEAAEAATEDTSQDSPSSSVITVGADANDNSSTDDDNTTDSSDDAAEGEDTE